MGMCVVGIGILGFVGWGVDLMPNNTSWVPSVVIWALALLWLIATLVYYFRRIRGKYSQGQRGDEFYFEFNDDSMTTKDGRLILGVTYSPKRTVTIETLQLEYNGKRFRPNSWNPIKISNIHTRNYTFDLNALRSIADDSSQEAVFIVKIVGVEYRSHPFNIYGLF